MWGVVIGFASGVIVGGLVFFRVGGYLERSATHDELAEEAKRAAAAEHDELRNAIVMAREHVKAEVDRLHAEVHALRRETVDLQSGVEELLHKVDARAKVVENAVKRARTKKR